MTTLREKVSELFTMSVADSAVRESVRSELQAFLEQAQDWPVTTRVPLSNVAFVVAGLLIEADPNVRRVVATDALQLRDGIG